MSTYITRYEKIQIKVDSLQEENTKLKTALKEAERLLEGVNKAYEALAIQHNDKYYLDEHSWFNSIKEYFGTPPKQKD